MKRLATIHSATVICVSCGGALYPDRGVAVTASVNISAQPPWGPAGYDYAPYYYFPDFNFYYDVDRALFHYYKVVIVVRDPWLHNRRLKNIYRKYRGIHTQPVRRDAPDYRRNPDPRKPHRTPYRHDNPPQRRDQRPARNDIRNSRNNDTGKGYRTDDRNSRPNRNGRVDNGGGSKKGATPTRSTDNGGNRQKDVDKSGSNSSGSRSTGSRGR